MTDELLTTPTTCITTTLVLSAGKAPRDALARRAMPRGRQAELGCDRHERHVWGDHRGVAVAAVGTLRLELCPRAQRRRRSARWPTRARGDRGGLRAHMGRARAQRAACDDARVASGRPQRRVSRNPPGAFWSWVRRGGVLLFWQGVCFPHRLKRRGNHTWGLCGRSLGAVVRECARLHPMEVLNLLRQSNTER